MAVAALLGCPSVPQPPDCSQPHQTMSVGRPVCPRGGTITSPSVPALTSTRRRHPSFSRLPSPRRFHHATPSPPAFGRRRHPASADCREPCERGGDSHLCRITSHDSSCADGLRSIPCDIPCDIPYCTATARRPPTIAVCDDPLRTRSRSVHRPPRRSPPPSTGYCPWPTGPAEGRSGDPTVG